MIFSRKAAPAPPRLVIQEDGNKPKNVLQYLGAGGMGKTLLLKELVRARMRRGGRTVVVDPNACFSGFGRVVTVEEAVRILRAAGARPFNLVVRPGRFRSSLNAIWEPCFEAGHLLVGADEASAYGGTAGCDPDFKALVIQGRNRYVDVALTCQKPSALHHEVRFNYSVACGFRQTSQRAAEMFATEYAGDRLDLVPLLKKLPQFHYLRAPFGGTVQAGRVTPPQSKG